MLKDLLNDAELRIFGQTYLRLITEGVISTRNSFWAKSANKIYDPLFHPFKDSLTLISNGFYNFSIKWQ